MKCLSSKIIFTSRTAQKVEILLNKLMLALLCAINYILLAVLLTGEFMIRLKPQFIDLVLDGSVTLSNRDMLQLAEWELLHINDGTDFVLSPHCKQLNQVQSERSLSNAGLTNTQAGMVKHLLHNFSALTIEHYSNLNRMLISRIRNGTYARHIPSVQCTLKQFIDSLDKTSMGAKVDYKFTLKGSVLLLHKYGVPNEAIADEFKVRLDTVNKIIADSKFKK